MNERWQLRPPKMITGQDGKLAGLVNDGTRSFFSLEFSPSPLEFLPIFQFVARISPFVVRMIILP